VASVDFSVPGYVYRRPLNEPGRDQLVLARRLASGTDVAVRLYGRSLSTPRERQRFEHEVAGLKALADVPHVTPLLDAGFDEADRPYVVTEFCVTGSLQDHLLAVGRLTPTEVRRVGAKLAGALVEVHRRDIFHRNLSPSTVLIDGLGEPSLTDFGLVALSLSAEGFPDPARPFVAPEAYLPELMTAAADIFALGATLYALLAGTTLAARFAAVVGDQLVDLPKVPFQLMSVLRQAMALDPQDRYVDAAHLRDALLTP
jgi:serine/threonine protein kinase